MKIWYNFTQTPDLKRRDLYETQFKGENKGKGT